MNSTKLEPLTISSTDKIIGGVCGGVGEFLKINPWKIRIILLISLCIFGVGIGIYLISWLVIPTKSYLSFFHQRKILGVCLFLSKKAEIDLSIVRILFLLSLIPSVGTTLIAYIVLFFLIK